MPKLIKWIEDSRAHFYEYIITHRQLVLYDAHNHEEVVLLSLCHEYEHSFKGSFPIINKDKEIMKLQSKILEMDIDLSNDTFLERRAKINEAVNQVRLKIAAEFNRLSLYT